MYNTILAVESSCDETSAAIILDGRTITSNIIATSTAMYAKYGGIVPEIAAREQQKYMIPVLTEAIAPLTKPGEHPIDTISRAVDAIAVAVGPGLIGSLLIGIETAKTIAFATKKPIIPVNHVLAHMYANFLDTGNGVPSIPFPAISLVVSGGHTELFLLSNEKTITWLGGTIDDAAGEAFDKTARLLGFGSRGGIAIQEAAALSHNGFPDIKLPRPMMHDSTLNFSFSGLKTAIMRDWNAESAHTPERINAFAAEVQEAITDVLVQKTLKAADFHGARSILVSGGVSANKRLREKFVQSIGSHHEGTIKFFVPPVSYCTDNAAYIGSYAYFRGEPTHWKTIDAVPSLSVEVTE